MMTQKRNVKKDLKWNLQRKRNEMMEQNPSEKTELVSVKGTDVKRI
jgi:hypothetical protein